MSLLLAALLVGAAPNGRVLEAQHALTAGRPEQARVMIQLAVAEGASGRSVDLLLADLAAAEHRWPEALARYRQLLAATPGNGELSEKAGIAALQAGDTAGAIPHLERAIRQPKPSWRSWNARGIAADRQQDWATADRAFAAGLKLEPRNPTLLNNRGWSLMLRGRWSEALRDLVLAHQLAPDQKRIADNAELAQAALDAGLPTRRAGESSAGYAARLNDAGIVALQQGNRVKAVAAFAQALDASDQWYARAADNLAAAEGKSR